MLEVSHAAPVFQVFNQDHQKFDLSQRRGKWTVLYFYPKASTPGCTRQACSIQDVLLDIRKYSAEVYGISADAPEKLKVFHQKYQLHFDLLSDPEGVVIEKYGVKKGVSPIAKRWTFLLDPHLKIQWIEKKVDPLQEGTAILQKLKELQK